MKLKEKYQNLKKNLGHKILLTVLRTFYPSVYALSCRMKKEDYRGTAAPAYFELQVPYDIVVDGDYSYDKIEYYHSDLDGRGFPNEKQCIDALREYGYKGDYLKEAVKEIRELYIKTEWRTEEIFFTKHGLELHLKQNDHNYRRGHRDYVNHAFRNPEIGDLFAMLTNNRRS